MLHLPGTLGRRLCEYDFSQEKGNGGSGKGVASGPKERPGKGFPGVRWGIPEIRRQLRTAPKAIAACFYQILSRHSMAASLEERLGWIDLD